MASLIKALIHLFTYEVSKWCTILSITGLNLMLFASVAGVCCVSFPSPLAVTVNLTLTF